MQMTKTGKETEILQTEVRNLSENRFLVSALLKTTGENGIFYSILVTLAMPGDAGDSCLAEDVSRCRSSAEALFARLVEGTVTPCTLKDVLEDLL